jgi:hypothetical protein
MSTNDPEFYQAPKFSPEQYQAPPRQRGCFFYGCIIASVLALLLLILLGVSIYLGVRWLNKMVDTYTATAPRDLPKVQMPEEERKALKSRVEAFRKAVNEGTPTDTLVLTSDDLNALIEEEPELKGKIYVKIEGDEVKGTVSMPLDKIKIPGLDFSGRYLNGEADLKASLKDGVLIVTLEAIEVNGQRVPDQMMEGIRRENLAKDAYKDEKSAEMMRKLESLEIKDGKIILKVRAKAGAASGEPTTKKAAPVEIVPPGSAQPKSEPSNSEPSKNGQPSPKAAAEPAPKAA